jgi:hypothetical protein
LARGVDSDQDFGYKRETSFLDLGLDFWRKTLILTICRDLELDESSSWRQDLS